MREFGTLLKKFYISLNKEVLEREGVLLAIETIVGIKLLPKEVFIKDGVLEITANPTVKNEIKIKEEKLLTALKETHSLSYSRILYK